MLQKNKNNKKVALSLICSCRSFLLCQMKSITYTGIYPGWVKIRMFYMQSSVPLEGDICWLCPPLPSALSLLEGTLKEHHCHVMCWCSPWLLPDTPQIQQNLLSPPVPFPGISHDLFTATPAVMLLLLRRTGPPPAALTLLEFKHLLSGTSCHGLLFTAIKLCWQLHKFFSWGKDPASLIQ